MFEFRFVKICEVVVWVQVELDGFKIECTWTCCLPNIFSTDCFWQNTAGASALEPKEQMEPQICFKPWASRPCWKTWILPTVRRSQQGRGKKSVMLSGSIWRRQISVRASQREMVEGFYCFLLFSTCIYLSLLDVVRVQLCIDLWSCRMSPSCPVYGFKMDCVPALVVVPRCFWQIVFDKTLQVLRRHPHPRSRWSRRSASSVESVVPAGRVEFSRLFWDPSRGVAKSS